MGWEADIEKWRCHNYDYTVDYLSSRSKIAGRVVIAHALGLWVAGMVGTIGTTAGFRFSGGGLGLFLGGVMSLPWMAGLGVLIWFCSDWIERHPFIFALIGPLVVCASYALFVGAFLDATAISSVTSSLCYLLLVLWSRLRSAAV